MTNQGLCPECGASWACEHRPEMTVEKKKIDDPHGPPVSIFKAQPIPSPMALKNMLRDAIYESPGQRRGQLMEALGFKYEYGQNAKSAPVIKAFNAALLDLRHKRQIIEINYGTFYPYTVELHRGLLEREIGSLEPWLEVEEKQLARHRAKLQRAKDEMASL